MSDTDRIKKLAEFMGWTIAPNPYGNDGEWLFLEAPRVHGGMLQYKLAPTLRLKDWNPLNCVHDVRLLEDEVESRGLWLKYIMALYEIVLGEQISEDAFICLEGAWHLTHATAEQRCAAIEGLMKEERDDRL